MVSRRRIIEYRVLLGRMRCVPSVCDRVEQVESSLLCSCLHADLRSDRLIAGGGCYWVAGSASECNAGWRGGDTGSWGRSRMYAHMPGRRFPLSPDGRVDLRTNGGVWRR